MVRKLTLVCYLVLLCSDFIDMSITGVEYNDSGGPAGSLSGEHKNSCGLDEIEWQDAGELSSLPCVEDIDGTVEEG